MNQHFISTLTILFPLILTSCQQPSESKGQDRFTGEYVAHVQLDSSTLLATEVINGLESPWDISIDPDGWVWFTELEGTVSRVNPETGESKELLKITDINRSRGRGLWSKVLHPEFEEHPYVFLHYTFAEQELGSRIVRYTFTGDTLTDRAVILDELPGGTGHNGSRLMIDKDNKLWMGTGDAHRGDLAQSLDSYHGKVLRMNLDGSVPEDNPIEGSRIWTSGHRNIQGITSGHNKIYISEHGPATDDEINLLHKGRNYGWPDVLGNCDSESEKQYCLDSLIVEPMVAFNPVVAPAGMEYYNHDTIPEWKNSLLLTTLRIQTLRILHLDDKGESVEDIQIFFQQYFGRLRDIAVDSKGRIFLLTSNTDWYKEARPDIHDPKLVENGDRIIMIQKADETLLALFENIENKKILAEDRIALYLGDSEIVDDMSASEQLYLTHCATCHRPNGTGGEGLAPSLITSEWVSGDRKNLINIMLNGIPQEARSDNYEWEMPVYRNLSNDEIAAILNYVRSEFSSESDQFRPDDIGEVRD